MPYKTVKSRMERKYKNPRSIRIFFRSDEPTCCTALYGICGKNDDSNVTLALHATVLTDTIFLQKSLFHKASCVKPHRIRTFVNGLHKRRAWDSNPREKTHRYDKIRLRENLVRFHTAFFSIFGTSSSSFFFFEKKSLRLCSAASLSNAAR